jgi:hypothetical protein
MIEIPDMARYGRVIAPPYTQKELIAHLLNDPDPWVYIVWWDSELCPVGHGRSSKLKFVIGPIPHEGAQIVYFDFEMKMKMTHWFGSESDEPAIYHIPKLPPISTGESSYTFYPAKMLSDEEALEALETIQIDNERVANLLEKKKKKEKPQTGLRDYMNLDYCINDYIYNEFSFCGQCGKNESLMHCHYTERPPCVFCMDSPPASKTREGKNDLHKLRDEQLAKAYAAHEKRNAIAQSRKDNGVPPKFWVRGKGDFYDSFEEWEKDQKPKQKSKPEKPKKSKKIKSTKPKKPKKIK